MQSNGKKVWPKKPLALQWENIDLGSKPFKYLSKPVTGIGDESLGSEDRNPCFWTKQLRLHPKGEKGSICRIIFDSKIFKFSMVCLDPINVDDGEFEVSIGPEDCDFIIGSDDGPVELEIVGYITRH